MGTYFHVNLSWGVGGQNFSFPTLFDSYRELLLIPAGCWQEKFSCDSVEGTSRSRRLDPRSATDD